MAEKTVKLKVLIDTIDKVKEFVKTVSQFEGDMDLISGRYIVDAKSILGLFSLDLTAPVEMKIEAPASEMDQILEALKPFEAQ